VTQQSVTMADVAKAAGVSRTTVSFVLNGRMEANIPEATRERINQTARMLGYRPNAAARTLASKRSAWFGLVTEIATSPFATDVIKGAQRSAWKDGNFLLIAPSDDDPGMEMLAVEKLLEQQVGGLIIATTWHREIIVPENAKSVPCVLVNCFDAEGEFPSIVPDEVAGGYAAAEILARAGHTNIGHITVAQGIPAQIGRQTGMKQALRDHGLSQEESKIVAGDGTADSGYHGTQELLAQPDPPTAIFCGNDRIAMGAYDAIKELGLRVGEDISIVGFDDQEILAPHMRPKLTTIALPFEEMGMAGVSLLNQMVEGSPIENRQITIGCPPRIRSSVAMHGQR
jgi:LacI family transcriptional regulator